jgi:hypothetical protein
MDKPGVRSLRIFNGNRLETVRAIIHATTLDICYFIFTTTFLDALPSLLVCISPCGMKTNVLLFRSIEAIAMELYRV